MFGCLEHNLLTHCTETQHCQLIYVIRLHRTDLHVLCNTNVLWCMCTQSQFTDKCCFFAKPLKDVLVSKDPLASETENLFFLVIDSSEAITKQLKLIS